MGVLGTAAASAVASELVSGSGSGILVNQAQSAAQSGGQAAQINTQQAQQMQNSAQDAGRSGFARNFYQGVGTQSPVVQYTPNGKGVDWGDTLIRAGGRYAQQNLLNGVVIENEKQKMANLFAS